jgi:hypothetical protein
MQVDALIAGEREIPAAGNDQRRQRLRPWYPGKAPTKDTVSRMTPAARSGPEHPDPASPAAEAADSIAAREMACRPQERARRMSELMRTGAVEVIGGACRRVLPELAWNTGTAPAVQRPGQAENIPATQAPAASGPAPVAVCLPGVPESVPAARRLLRESLSWCPRAEDLAQAVTELAANAVCWSASGEGGTFTVRIRTAPRWARIEVIDNGPALHPAAASNGRGLLIVAAVTDRSGTTFGPDRSQTAWAEVTWPQPATPVAPANPLHDADRAGRKNGALHHSLWRATCARIQPNPTATQGSQIP